MISGVNIPANIHMNLRENILPAVGFVTTFRCIDVQTHIESVIRQERRISIVPRSFGDECHVRYMLASFAVVFSAA